MANSTDGKTLCVIAPHPDDEVLGVGGTILKAKDRGHRVHVIMMTRAYPPLWSEDLILEKRREAERVAELLGLDGIVFLDFPTLHLASLPPIDVNGRVLEVVKKIGAEVLYAPQMNDINSDHRVAFDAAAVAARPHPGNPVKTLYSYETVSTTRLNHHDTGWYPNVYEDITDYIEKKLEVLAIYKSEMGTFPHPRSIEAVRIFARERGLAVGMAYAETMMLVRDYRG